MTAPAPPPAPGGPGQTITVTPENVLAARRVIGEAAAHARDRLMGISHDLRVKRAADDDVSRTAASIWNGHLLVEPDSHFNRLLSYVERVEELGQQLEETARQYGITEDEITSSFRSARTDV